MSTVLPPKSSTSSSLPILLSMMKTQASSTMGLFLAWKGGFFELSPGEFTNFINEASTRGVISEVLGTSDPGVRKKFSLKFSLAHSHRFATESPLCGSLCSWGGKVVFFLLYTAYHAAWLKKCQPSRRFVLLEKSFQTHPTLPRAVADRVSHGEECFLFRSCLVGR